MCPAKSCGEELFANPEIGQGHQSPLQSLVVWLRAEGCEVGARMTTDDGKRLRVVKGLKRNRGGNEFGM